MEGFERLQQYLTQHHVTYEVTRHPLAYTAPEVAAATHVQGRMMAKVVIAVCGEEEVMLVLPASSHVHLGKLRAVLGAAARLAHEAEFKARFPDCEVGAMPPFGNLYGLRVFVDRALAEEPMIAFQAGTHRHTISLHFADLERLVQPVIVDFAAAETRAEARIREEARAW